MQMVDDRERRLRTALQTIETDGRKIKRNHLIRLLMVILIKKRCFNLLLVVISIPKCFFFIRRLMVISNKKYVSLVISIH